MRIGIDARVLQNERRGQGQYVYYLIQELIKLGRHDEYLLFYNGFKKGRFAFGEDIPNLRQVWASIPGSLLKPLWSRCKFPPIEYLLGKVDVFHHTFNYNFTHYTPVPAYAPSVVTFNGMAPPETIWDSAQYNLKEIDRWFRIIARSAAKIIAVSRMAKDDLLKRVNVPEEKIRIIYCGVNENFMSTPDPLQTDLTLVKYGLKGARYIFYAGAAEKNKNLDGLIDGFRMIMGKPGIDDIHLVMAGSIDDNFQRLMRKVKELGLDKRVIFPGYISHESLPSLYRGAEAFVLPTFREWFGIPVLEAMASGVPVVVSKNTGALEIVGDAAVTFDPFDTRDIAAALEKIVRDRPLRRDLIALGLKRVSGYSWKKAAEETLSVYKEVGEGCGH
ncbi:MAG: hypothetical protein A2Y00_07340 [Omnitrophica WOR_2 bacterium GWF2_43_52]|nr:MAG: hypothetical protein A2062_07435 [Omnitrophica WOR_2 bacterium GWA2_44_7]OGX16678.1 MAG: hypothetical protein A2Y01_01015 [Omnitrophica WOR_2 bacterium GWC2_44_8]OGX20233.1 MAG: hypothetical protein A2Y00_07340 [Omnitrophica WOR_2 bacterium GWF2_43_52]HAH20747.1 hypothetical protein [Candidatus Omnitrophota bacterium]HBG63615.1 hypothetical protein [Candidatus Omnitrophota bacterium]